MKLLDKVDCSFLGYSNTDSTCKRKKEVFIDLNTSNTLKNTYIYIYIYIHDTILQNMYYIHVYGYLTTQNKNFLKQQSKKNKEK